VILRDRSPPAMAVRHLGDVCGHLAGEGLPAIELTLVSVRSFQVPATPGTVAWARQSFAFGADTRGRRGVTSEAKALRLVHHGVQRFPSIEGFSPDTFTVIFFDRSPCGDGGRHLGNVTHLSGQGSDAIELTVCRSGLFPGACDAGATSALAAGGLPSVPTSRGDAASLPRRSRLSWFHHGVDGVFQLENFARARPR